MILAQAIVRLAKAVAQAGGATAPKGRVLASSSVMARRMIIYDIGFDEDRVAGQMVFYGKPWTTENEIGKYYMLELELTHGYPLKAFMRIPGSNFASKNIK